MDQQLLEEESPESEGESGNDTLYIEDMSHCTSDDIDKCAGTFVLWLIVVAVFTLVVVYKGPP